MVKVIDSLPNENDYDNKAALRSLNKGVLNSGQMQAEAKQKKSK
jgi:hypothetical protein